MNKKLRVSNKEEWRDFALGYLHIAELACDEILNKKFNNVNFDIVHLYIPALYNIKHAIEILLKVLTIEFLNKEVLDQSDYSHDIETIFFKLKEVANEKRLKFAIEKWEKTNSVYKGKLDGKLILEELEGFVNKYHNLDFLKSVIGTNYHIKDIDNTAFKYPTNNLTIQLDYTELSKSFTESMVTETRFDAVKLEGVLWKLYVLIYVERGV